MDGLIDRQKTLDFETFSSPPPSCQRSSEQSIVPNLLSVEQKRSPHILPESTAFKNLSPHVSPTTRAEICCKVPIKSPYMATQYRAKFITDWIIFVLINSTFARDCHTLLTFVHVILFVAWHRHLVAWHHSKGLLPVIPCVLPWSVLHTRASQQDGQFRWSVVSIFCPQWSSTLPRGPKTSRLIW